MSLSVGLYVTILGWVRMLALGLFQHKAVVVGVHDSLEAVPHCFV